MDLAVVVVDGVEIVLVLVLVLVLRIRCDFVALWLALWLLLDSIRIILNDVM